MKRFQNFPKVNFLYEVQGFNKNFNCSICQKSYITIDTKTQQKLQDSLKMCEYFHEHCHLPLIAEKITSLLPR